MRAERSTGLGWPKRSGVTLRWLDLDRNDLSDRVRWKSLVELEVRQKPATRSGHGGER